MKVSNNQKPTEGNEGVSRDALNNWQRQDAHKTAQQQGGSKESKRPRKAEEGKS